MNFDPTKPVQTRGGENAGIYGTRGFGKYSIHGWVEFDGKKTISTWTESGHSIDGVTGAADLINLPDEAELVPYTLETFPLWAIWVRPIGAKYALSVTSVVYEGVYPARGNFITYLELLDRYEIAGTDGIWNPAGEEVSK